MTLVKPKFALLDISAQKILADIGKKPKVILEEEFENEDFFGLSLPFWNFLSLGYKRRRKGRIKMNREG